MQNKRILLTLSIIINLILAVGIIFIALRKPLQETKSKKTSVDRRSISPKSVLDCRTIKYNKDLNEKKYEDLIWEKYSNSDIGLSISLPKNLYYNYGKYGKENGAFKGRPTGNKSYTDDKNGVSLWASEQLPFFIIHGEKYDKSMAQWLKENEMKPNLDKKLYNIVKLEIRNYPAYWINQLFDSDPVVEQYVVFAKGKKWDIQFPTFYSTKTIFSLMPNPEINPELYCNELDDLERYRHYNQKIIERILNSIEFL